MSETYQYDVAFSFAGEDRTYVEKVALYLKEKNIVIFYDYFEEENLWGKNLVSYLEDIYTNKSKYCVIFISQYYAQKQWTCYESASAMVRMLENNVKQEEYILPVKFDETKVPGILSTIGCIDGKKKTPEELGELIIKKLHTSRESIDVSLPVKVFRENLIKALSADFPSYWSVTYEEGEQNVKFQYSYHNFNYYLEIMFRMEEKILLINSGYTNLFFNAHTFIPSVKIVLNLENESIKNGRIINLDFFDYMNTDVLSPSEIIKQIKDEILKKGET